MTSVKKILNVTLYVVIGVVVAGVAAIMILNKPVPDGDEGPAAEALADKLLSAVNEPAWSSLRYLAWDYRGQRQYVWDKWYNIAEVSMGEYRVLINLNTLEGRAWSNNQQLQGEAKRARLQEAWEYWCNDSFWLNPIVKIRDEGTVRKSVILDSKKEGLLVTYTEGGVTPGDSFLWIFDENGLPLECRMWVKMLPFKGLKVTWEDWLNIDGALVSQKHQVGPVTIEVNDIRCGDHHSDLGLEKDPFTDF